jgi:hypothetical protein
MIGFFKLLEGGSVTYSLCQRCAESVGRNPNEPQVQKRIEAYITGKST